MGAKPCYISLNPKDDPCRCNKTETQTINSPSRMYLKTRSQDQGTWLHKETRKR